MVCFICVFRHAFISVFRHEVISIEGELNGSLRPDVNGLPTLVTVKTTDIRTRGTKRLFATTVEKRNSTLQYKARLCI